MLLLWYCSTPIDLLFHTSLNKIAILIHSFSPKECFASGLSCMPGTLVDSPIQHLLWLETDYSGDVLLKVAENGMGGRTAFSPCRRFLGPTVFMSMSGHTILQSAKAEEIPLAVYIMRQNVSIRPHSAGVGTIFNLYFLSQFCPCSIHMACETIYGTMLMLKSESLTEEPSPNPTSSLKKTTTPCPPHSFLPSN